MTEECNCRQLFFLHFQCGKDCCVNYWPADDDSPGMCSREDSSHFGMEIDPKHYAPISDDVDYGGEAVEVTMADGTEFVVFYECFESDYNAGVNA